MEEKNQAFRVDEIMADIRREIADQHLADDLAGFDEVSIPSQNLSSSLDFDSQAFLDSVDSMNACYPVAAFRPLNGNPIKVFIKRVLRKLLKFYVEPVANDVTIFNTYSVQAMNQARNFVLTQQANGRRITLLEQQLENRDKDVAELRARLGKLEAQLNTKQEG